MSEPTRCAHCPQLVHLDGRGVWTHADDRGYQCRDDTNVLLLSYAEPADWPGRHHRNETPEGRW